MLLWLLCLTIVKWVYTVVCTVVGTCRYIFFFCPSEDVFVQWGAQPPPELGLNTTDGSLWDFYAFLDDKGKSVYCNKYKPSRETKFGTEHRVSG